MASKSSYDFEGKVALVTGGATGIGLCYVKSLLEAGVKGISIVDFNAELGQEVLAELGTDRVIFIKTDVTNHDELSEAFTKTKTHFGSLDIVVNNAGIMNDAVWRREIEINVTAVADGTLLAFDHMRKDKGGNGGWVVNTASVVGFEAYTPTPVYSGTKAFVINFGRSFSGPFYENLTGVKVVTLCPGMTRTALLQNINHLDFEGSKEYSFNAAKDHYIGQSPENLGKGLIEVISGDAETGSVWVCECDKKARLLPPQLEPVYIK